MYGLIGGKLTLNSNVTAGTLMCGARVMLHGGTLNADIGTEVSSIIKVPPLSGFVYIA